MGGYVGELDARVDRAEALFLFLHIRPCSTGEQGFFVVNRIIII